MSDFWTKRRQRVAEEEAQDILLQQERAEAEQAALQEEKSDEDLLAELELPNPDELKLGDDISGFMSKAVPDRLRRRALRKLWTLNPVLANVDGLVDYGEDFTDAATVIENMQTTYQVGKGMLQHVLKMEEEAAAKAKAEADDVEDPDQDLDLEDAETPEEPEEEPLIASSEKEPSVEFAFAPDPEDHVTPLPRRMRFQFAQDTAQDIAQ